MQQITQMKITPEVEKINSLRKELNKTSYLGDDEDSIAHILINSKKNKQ